MADSFLSSLRSRLSGAAKALRRSSDAEPSASPAEMATSTEAVDAERERIEQAAGDAAAMIGGDAADDLDTPLDDGILGALGDRAAAQRGQFASLADDAQDVAADDEGAGSGYGSDMFAAGGSGSGRSVFQSGAAGVPVVYDETEGVVDPGLGKSGRELPGFVQDIVDMASTATDTHSRQAEEALGGDDSTGTGTPSGTTTGTSSGTNTGGTGTGGGTTPESDAGVLHEQDNDDGSTTTVYNDGTIVTAWPDGKTEVNHPDGTIETSYPDGTHVEEYPDGSSSTVHPDGTVEETPPPEGEEGSDDSGSDSGSDDSGSDDSGGESGEEGSDDSGGESGEEGEGADAEMSGDPDGEGSFAPPPELTRWFAGDVEAAKRHKGGGQDGGDVDPADDAVPIGAASGPIRDLKRDLLGGDRVDPDDGLGGPRTGEIGPIVNPDSGVTDPADDATSTPSGMGPTERSTGGGTIEGGIDQARGTATDDAGDDEPASVVFDAPDNPLQGIEPLASVNFEPAADNGEDDGVTASIGGFRSPLERVDLDRLRDLDDEDDDD